MRRRTRLAVFAAGRAWVWRGDIVSTSVARNDARGKDDGRKAPHFSRREGLAGGGI